MKASLYEMSSVGAQTYQTENKKKPLMSYFIHKKDQVYDAHVFRKEDKKNKDPSKFGF